MFTIMILPLVMLSELFLVMQLNAKPSYSRTSLSGELMLKAKRGIFLAIVIGKKGWKLVMARYILTPAYNAIFVFTLIFDKLKLF